MNKVFNINLGGIVFTIDDVAFEKLNRYINKLKAHFAGTDGAADIIADIEARMAELIQQKLASPETIVNEAVVDEVIAVMGDVEELGGSSTGGEANSGHASAEMSQDRKLRRNTSDKVLGGVCSGIAHYLGLDPALVRLAFLVAFFAYGSGLLFYIILWIIMPAAAPAETYAYYPNRKRLFRDGDDKILGGVCSGVANYLGVDPVWVRIFFAVSFFVFSVGFWIYIALWIAVPKAITAAQKLQMKGDPIDVSGIEREIKSTFSNARQQAPKAGNEMRGVASRSAHALSEIAAAVLQVFGKLIAVILIAIGIGLCGIACIVMSYVGFGKTHWMDFLSMAVDGPGLLTIIKAGVVLAIGIPLLSFVITGFRLLLNLRFRRGPLYSVLGLLSFIGFALLVYAGIEYYSSVETKATVTQKIALTRYDTLYLVTGRKEFDGRSLSISDHRSEYHIRMGEDGLLQQSQSLAVRRSLSDSSFLEIKKNSKGETLQDAMQLSNTYQYGVSARDSMLILDEGVFVPRNVKWKYPQVRMNLYVPVGTVMYVDKGVLNMLNRNMRREKFYRGSTMMMTENGLKCLDCMGGTMYSDDDDDIDINLNVNENDSVDSHISVTTGNRKVIIRNGKKIEVKEKHIGPVRIKVEEEEKDEE
jgi:phage shock protein PspC (stress-responsive transcriptional regulator)